MRIRMGENMNKLAVIVPVYNKEKYLGKCLESICRQTYPDLEIILVDDGSTDASGAICDACAKKDHRINVIHQENQGMVKARHNGLLACDCEYATFVDADDWLVQDAFSVVSDYMEKQVDVIAYGKIREKGMSGNILPVSSYAYGAYTRQDIERDIFPSMIWDFQKGRPGLTQSLCDKVIRRSLLLRSFELAGHLGKMNHGEDCLILYPLMRWVQSLYMIKENLYYYRQVERTIPEYLSSDQFFEKLYLWYMHLTKYVTEFPDGRKQLEYLYIFFAESRKACYGDVTARAEYVFPFQSVPARSRIVLWGAGKLGRIYYEQVRRTGYCEIAAWGDRNYPSCGEHAVIKPENLSLNPESDYIVIAMLSESAKDEITARLKEMGVSEKRIIWQIQ